MYKDFILLENVEKVRSFSAFANNYKEKISLVEDDIRVDAKSMMGIFTLDLSKPVRVEVEVGDEGCPEDLKLGIKKYKAEDSTDV